MKINTYILFFLGFIIPVFMSSCNEEHHEETSRKIGFVKNQKLYSEFSMAKEMDSDLKNTASARQTLLDSLGLEIKSITNQLQNMVKQDQELLFVLDEKQRLYMTKSKEFTQANELMVQNTYADIWNRINLYTKEYGEENGYQYIFGAMGNGGLMYADSTEDITQELIDYCNKRYSGE